MLLGDGKREGLKVGREGLVGQGRFGLYPKCNGKISKGFKLERSMNQFSGS